MSLEDISGVLVINSQGRDEGEEKCLYCNLEGWMTFNLYGWCCCLFEVSNAVNIAPNALEGGIYVGLCLKDLIELVCKGEALNKC